MWLNMQLRHKRDVKPESSSAYTLRMNLGADDSGRTQPDIFPFSPEMGKTLQQVSSV